MPVAPSEPTAIVFVDSMSGPETYQCTRFERQWQCECASFRMRRGCKHTDLANDAVRGARFDGVRVDFVRGTG